MVQSKLFMSWNHLTREFYRLLHSKKIIHIEGIESIFGTKYVVYYTNP